MTWRVSICLMGFVFFLMQNIHTEIHFDRNFGHRTRHKQTYRRAVVALLARIRLMQSSWVRVIEISSFKLITINTLLAHKKSWCKCHSICFTSVVLARLFIFGLYILPGFALPCSSSSCPCIVCNTSIVQKLWCTLKCRFVVLHIDSINGGRVIVEAKACTKHQGGIQMHKVSCCHSGFPYL